MTFSRGRCAGSGRRVLFPRVAGSSRDTAAVAAADSRSSSVSSSCAIFSDSCSDERPYCWRSRYANCSFKLWISA